MNEDYDEYDDLVYQGLCRLREVGLAILIAIGVCLLLTGCKTVYVPVETVHTDTLIMNKWQHDSIWVEIMKHDSVIVKEKGDSVIVEHWKTEWRDRWRDREVHDTLYCSKSDTIQVPYPVEKKVPFFERVKIGCVGAVAGVAVVGMIGMAVWLRRRYKRM